MSWGNAADNALPCASRLDFFPVFSWATPHNCVCESQPPFCPTSSVWKTRNIAQPLPAQAGLRMRHTPCGYIQYSFVFQTLNWDKNPGWAFLSNYAVLPLISPPFFSIIHLPLPDSPRTGSGKTTRGGSPRYFRRKPSEVFPCPAIRPCPGSFRYWSD